MQVWRDQALRVDLRLTICNKLVVDIDTRLWYNPYMNKGMNMTDLETAETLLAAFTAATAKALADYRDLEESGLMDVFYVDMDDEEEGI